METVKIPDDHPAINFCDECGRPLTRCECCQECKAFKETNKRLNRECTNLRGGHLSRSNEWCKKWREAVGLLREARPLVQDAADDARRDSTLYVSGRGLRGAAALETFGVLLVGIDEALGGNGEGKNCYPHENAIAYGLQMDRECNILLDKVEILRTMLAAAGVQTGIIDAAMSEIEAKYPEEG